MRVSSVIFPSASGTLKSTRINTRLPATSRSESDSLFTAGLPQNEFDDVAQTHAEAPLVVVPRENFQHSVAEGLGERAVDDRRVRVVQEVGRNEFLVAELENAFQRTLRRGLERCIGGLDAHR